MRYHEIINEADDERALARATLSKHPSMAAIEPDLPPFAEWVSLAKSKASFSEFHFNGNEAFELPFYPGDFVYSPIVNLPIPAGTTASGAGHYRRGVKKYQTMIKQGKPIPPITFVFNHDGSWYRMDGNHRWEAAVTSGMNHIPAVFALPKHLR